MYGVHYVCADNQKCSDYQLFLAIYITKSFCVQVPLCNSIYCDIILCHEWVVRIYTATFLFWMTDLSFVAKLM